MDRHFSRREFLEAAGAAAAVAASPGAVRCATRDKQSDGLNVLFLMTDEQHHRSLSLTGNAYIETPHMDRIGREGVRFDQATCVTPYCSPSRASLITGVYPHTHGIVMNVSRRGNQQPLAQDAFPNTETILDYVGIAVPEGIHGRSMRPLVEGRRVAWRDHAFCQRGDHLRMLRTERYKFFYRPRPRVVALYDLKSDPHEDHNLATDAAAAETVRRMHRRLLKVMAGDGDPMRDRFAGDPLA